MERKSHWDSVYRSKVDSEVSWTQAEPNLSLSLIREFCPKGRIIDVGGGTSKLAERLLDEGYSVTVLDISEAAINRAKANAGVRAGMIEWIISDATADPALTPVELWHDRAVFHFLTELTERAAYVALMRRTVVVGGYVVMATFALDGPRQCSGLEVIRYDEESLLNELGSGFARIKTVPEVHVTPWGKQQSFQYSIFRRQSPANVTFA